MSGDLALLLSGESPSLLPPIAVPQLDFDHRNFRPRTKQNVGYIVCGLAFDDDENVLMMQEAKRSCRGRWYLPAGRLEPNETLVEGVVREVLEETGLHYEPETVLCVEMNGVAWQRVTFIGRTAAGRLKPKPDEESLDAKWMKYPDLKAMPIRNGDIFSLIELGLEYLRGASRRKFPPVLPIETKFERIFLRLVLVSSFTDDGKGGGGSCCCESDESLHVLVDAASGQLPVLGMGGVSTNIKKILTVASKHLTAGGLKELTCRGLLATEHDGRSPSSDVAGDPHDGLCHTFHLQVGVESRQSCADGFRWEKLDEKTSLEMGESRLLPAVLFL